MRSRSERRDVTTRVLLCAVMAGLAGCGAPQSTAAESPRSQPPSIQPLAHWFCDGVEPGSGSSQRYCEDFKNVPDGALPTRWLEGDGLLVKPIARVRGLVSSERKQQNGVVLQDVVPRGDYHVEALFVVDQATRNLGENHYELDVGSVTATVVIGTGLVDGNFIGCYARINETISKPFTCPTAPKSTLLGITKQGLVLHLDLDGREVALARLTAEPPPGAVAFRANLEGWIRGDEGHGFDLRGIRAEWVSPSAPSDSGTAGDDDAARRCATAASQINALSIGKNAKVDAATSAALVRAMTDSCAEDHWAPEVVACFIQAQSSDDKNACWDKLSADQRTRAQERGQKAAMRAARGS